MTDCTPIPEQKMVMLRLKHFQMLLVELTGELTSYTADS
jgi:hypothetical protein